TIRKQTLEDAKVRNRIEGKFGQAKRRFSLNRVMTKLANTSETAIAITFLVMNLEALLKRIVFRFSWFCFAGNSLFFLRGNRSLTLILFLGNFLVDSQSIIPFLFAHSFPLSLFFSKP
ncbi:MULTISPECIES: transposase, partial [Pseudanabaena]